MAVKLITNGLVSGALAALTDGRWLTAVTTTAYADEANVASAIATEVLAINAASGAAMADADNLNVGQLCEAVTNGVLNGRNPVSIVALDYATIAATIYAAAKACVAKLVVPGADDQVENGFICGIAGALVSGRWLTAHTAAEYATMANVVAAIANECMVANAALLAPMANASNAQICQLCCSTAFGVMEGRNPTSTTLADYLNIATAIANITKATVAKLL
jgi:hypothetical protein